MRDLSKFYKELEKTHGKAVAEATEDFFGIYTDGIYKWLAQHQAIGRALPRGLFQCPAH